MLKFLTLAAFCLTTPAFAQQATNAPAGILRALDKTSGNTADVQLLEGQSTRLGTLSITMNECRFPEGNPSGDAYAELLITEEDTPGALFSGWMIASAPALSALEHQRYDVWVIRCVTS